MSTECGFPVLPLFLKVPEVSFFDCVLFCFCFIYCSLNYVYVLDKIELFVSVVKFVYPLFAFFSVYISPVSDFRRVKRRVRFGIIMHA